MKKFSFVFICFLTSAFSVHSSALFEIRLGYDLVNTSGVKDNDDNIPNMKTPAGLSADALLVIQNFVGGLRYQNLSERKSTGAGAAYDAKFTNTSLVAGYRFLNEVYFLGPLATLGTSNINYSYNPVGGVNSDINAKNKSSYGVGIEGGFQASGYMVGGEIGYLSSKMGTLKNNISADMSGVYTRIIAGFTF